VPLIDIGSTGEDKGKGGKHLVLPPDFKGEVPPGYIPVRPRTYNTFTGVRSIPKSYSEEDVRKGDALVKQIKVYLLSAAAKPPEQRFIDMTDILYEGLVRYDASFYASLAHILNEEPVQPRDLERMSLLLPLGIEKSKAFKPDAVMTAELKSAAQEAQAWLVEGLARVSTERLWPDSKWVLPVPPIATKTLFKWEVANHFDVDSRGIGLASFFLPPATLGKGSFYLGCFVDANDKPLRGENTYRIRVPANAPVREFWALTVYDKETDAIFRESTRLTVGSLDKDLRKNSDGSVDIYIGPKVPAGWEANWIYTPPRQGWWPYFRFFGPGPALFEGTWKLPDLEKVP